MNNQLHEFARDSSCLLCLTPENGGTWYCPTRPPKLRDFSKPYNWDTLQQALRDLPWNDDYHFEFEFTIDDMLENGRNWIMYQSEGRIAFFMDKDARGSRFTIGTFSFSGGAYIYTTFQPSLAGKHKVIVTVTGDMLRVTVDDVIYEQTGERVASSAYDRAVTTSGPIIFHNISLTNDTSQTVLWTSAYTDLYDTLIPQPSAIPYNFAENAKAFYDYQAAVREALDPTHDYSFLIDFKLDEAKTSGNVFYASLSDAPFALIFQGNNQIDFFTNLLKPNGGSGSFASIYAYYQSDVKLQGRHQIECKIEANMLSSYLDGVLVAQKTSNLERTGTAAVGLPHCNSGYVYKIQITDLTDNQVVWSYPSEAERVRLITKTNVRTDRGAFEAADETQPARVDTALDLRGKVSSYTVVVDFEAAEMDTDISAQQLCGQGSATNMTAVDIAACMYYRQDSRYYLRHVWELAGSSILFYAEVEKLTGRHQLTAVLQINETSSGSAAMLYLDGKLIHTANNNNVPTGAGSAESFSLMEPANTSQTYSRKYGKIYSCLLFDRAFSAAEIAALTSHSIGGI